MLVVMIVMVGVKCKECDFDFDDGEVININVVVWC